MFSSKKTGRKNIAVSALLIAGSLGLMSHNAFALQKGDTYVRIGVVDLDPATAASKFAANDANLSIVRPAVVPLDDTNFVAGRSSRPSVMLGHMLTDNLSIDVILAPPLKHDFQVAGANPLLPLAGLDGVLGTVKTAPFNFSMLWHFSPQAVVRPYVGAGVVYAVIFDETFTKSNLAGTTADLEISDEVGFLAQIGVDFDLTANWFMNIDYKYISADDIEVRGNRVPVPAGLGLGPDVDLETQIDLTANAFNVSVGFTF